MHLILLVLNFDFKFYRFVVFDSLVIYRTINIVSACNEYIFEHRHPVQ